MDMNALFPQSKQTLSSIERTAYYHVRGISPLSVVITVPSQDV